MEKKVSVVIPTYKRPALLKKCILALAKQEFPLGDFEIIVVSDGPDEKTRNMLHSIDHVMLPFVQYITLPKNSGPAAARNAGWRKAKGRIVAFTDDDCLPQPAWLSSIWQRYTKSSCPRYIAYTGKVVVPLSEQPTDFELNTSHLEKADFVTANCACTKKTLLRIKGFDERFKVAWREDSDLEFKLIENKIPIEKIHEAVVVHPVRKAQWGVSIREQKKTMFNALLYKKYPSLFREKIQPSPAWNYYGIVAGFITLMGGLFLQHKLLVIVGGTIYLGLTIAFIMRRLVQTSKSYPHVLEMITTSLVIPFISIYWTIYGSFKYRVLFY